MVATCCTSVFRVESFLEINTKTNAYTWAAMHDVCISATETKN